MDATALRERMREGGWSQAALAQALGVSASTLHRWLSGKRELPSNLRERIDAAEAEGRPRAFGSPIAKLRAAFGSNKELTTTQLATALETSYPSAYARAVRAKLRTVIRDGQRVWLKP